jgi:hypothetical protein
MAQELQQRTTVHYSGFYCWVDEGEQVSFDYQLFPCIEIHRAKPYVA